METRIRRIERRSPYRVKNIMKKSMFYLVKYEILNNLYNGYSFFFGAVFPIFLMVMISKGALSDVPASMKPEVTAGIFLGMSMIIPLSTMFLGYAASFSNELEKDVPTRLNLFGLSANRLFTGKLIANFIFLTFCLIIYLIGTLSFVKVASPKPFAAVIWVLSLYLISAFCLALAHGIANMIRKFGITYGVVMGIYFVMMGLGGMMGVRTNDFPTGLRKVSELLPFTHFGNGYIDFWMGRLYNFAPLVQSLIFFAAVSMIVMLVSFKVRGRKEV